MKQRICISSNCPNSSAATELLQASVLQVRCELRQRNATNVKQMKPYRRKKPQCKHMKIAHNGITRAKSRFHVLSNAVLAETRNGNICCGGIIVRAMSKLKCRSELLMDCVGWCFHIDIMKALLPDEKAILLGIYWKQLCTRINEIMCFIQNTYTFYFLSFYCF